MTFAANSAHAEIAGPTPFGKAPDGSAVDVYTLKNKNGVTAKVMTLGATLVELLAPDKAGKFANVVLGFDKADDYSSDRNQYFGCTTGRVANRIAKGKFSLDGKEYTLAVNNNPNHLHGGVKRSLDKVNWKAAVSKVTGDKATYETVGFTYTSPDGEEGYPGKVDFTVHYRLTDKNELVITYFAKTDKATPINLTNHSYFNLAGAGADSVLDHELKLDAQAFTPIDDTAIPTGKIEPVKGTPFDFAKRTRLGARIDPLVKSAALGYDHNLVLSKRGAEPTYAGELRDPSSGRVMTILTNQPTIQVYTGNYLKEQVGKDGKTYKQRSAVCLETYHYPDAVNQPAFPSIILRPGQRYDQTCVYAFSAE